MANHDLRCTQFVDFACKSSNSKGNTLLFAVAPKVSLALSANSQRVMEHRMQYTFIFADFLDFSGGG
jgi:hypothetical protein